MSEQMHAVHVFAPGRIQENILGELFMYWFRAREVLAREKFLWNNYFCKNYIFGRTIVTKINTGRKK